MVVFSKTSEECKKCEYFEDCENKRLVLCAMKESPTDFLSKNSEGASSSVVQDVLVKHDYRDIKLNGSMTITIDLEEVKKEVEREFYKQLGCPWLEYGG